MKKYNNKIYRGIKRVCRYFGSNPSIYQKNKITYLIAPPFISGVDFAIPDGYTVYLNINEIKIHIVAYIHETVHLAEWTWYPDNRSLMNGVGPWLEEGLAVYLNDKLNDDPHFPNFGGDIDLRAKYYIFEKDENLDKLFNLYDIDSSTITNNIYGFLESFINTEVPVKLKSSSVMLKKKYFIPSPVHLPSFS